MEIEIAFTILGMAVVTYLTRFVPIALLSKARIPERISIWISYVPIAVLSAIVVPGVFYPKGFLDISVRNGFLMGSVVTVIASLKFRSYFKTILVAIAIGIFLTLVGLI